MDKRDRDMIRNPDRVKQAIEFNGMKFGPSGYPTDFDSVVEYHDKGWIVFEVKYKDTRPQLGQKLALQRFSNDMAKSGKFAIVFIVEHDISDPNEKIYLRDCRVREMCINGAKWRPPHKPMTAKEICEKLLPYIDHNCTDLIYP